MEIYLLRHALAGNAKPGQPDSERALTEEGREKLTRVLKRAHAAGVKPHAILSSPYRRALETAALAAEALGYSGEIERIRALEPDVSPYDVWDEIRRRVPDGPLLLVGHEPLLSALAAYLLNSPALLIDMKKSALVRVDCERAGPQPKCALKWIITPVTA